MESAASVCDVFDLKHTDVSKSMNVIQHDCFFAMSVYCGSVLNKAPFDNKQSALLPLLLNLMNDRGGLVFAGAIHAVGLIDIICQYYSHTCLTNYPGHACQIKLQDLPTIPIFRKIFEPSCKTDAPGIFIFLLFLDPNISISVTRYGILS